MLERSSVWRGGLLVALLWAGPLRISAREEPDGNWPELRERTFAMVWDTVNTAYYDPTFGGVDWTAVGAKYREYLPKAGNKEELRTLLLAMLGELRRTHFSIQPRELAVFTPAERGRIGTVGLDLAYVEQAVAVSRVKPDSPAAHGGVQAGEVIEAIDGIELAPLQSYLEKSPLTPARRGLYLVGMATGRLHGSVGAKVHLRLRRPPPAAAAHAVELEIGPVEGPWSEPMGDYPSVPLEWTAACDPTGIGYLHFNIFARQAMKDIRGLLRAVPADGGLVIDLRGNPGGIAVMAPGISGWLSDHTFSLGTMHLREGHIGYTVSPQEKAFLGPVAVLIDCGSASTSEIMAAGLQEAKRARVFGETSPGAALPSLFKALPTGDLLQYAIADLQTPAGVLIEGRGVVPDETVARTLADLADARDPVLETARRWLETARQKPAAATAKP